MTRQMPTALGIDVGGTFMKAGLVSADGDVLARDRMLTEAERGPDAMIARMAELAARVRSGAGLSPVAIGLGVPGTLSHARGIVLSPPNLPGWRDVPVVKMLSDLTGLPVRLENDANCAAVGEHARGAGRGAEHMVLLTLGTGVGGGVILGGKLWRGAGECAGEWGHVIVQIDGRPCNCGQNGCLEAYASASNTAVRAAELIVAGVESELKEILDRGEQLTAEHVLAAAEKGDDVASRIWQDTCKYLAVACINIQHAINPQRIVLAGGMSAAAGMRLIEPVIQSIREIGSKIVGSPPQVCLAELGNDAGFIGAALEALRGE